MQTKTVSKISLIIPVFNEEENIPYLYKRIRDVRENVFPDELEVIFIDDSSTDNSFTLLSEIAENDKGIKLIRFSRNFGSHIACYAGIINSSGDACAFISADLQDPPELLHALVKKWKQGYEIVLGVRDKNREASLFEKAITRGYTYLMRRFALKNLPEGSTDVFLIDRKVVEVIKTIKEKHPNIFGLILWSGFKQIEIPYKKEARQFGKSKWNTSKKIKIFIDSFVSFSYVPIRMMSLLGIIVAFTGFLYAFIVIFNKIFFSSPIAGWTSLMVVVLMVSGVQMIMLGILGEYLWRNFDASRQRPPFIISGKIGFDEEKDSSVKD